MFEHDKKGAIQHTANGTPVAKTSHTLNPVPCILHSADETHTWHLKKDSGAFGLSNIAATMVNLMGYEAPPMWDASLLDFAE